METCESRAAVPRAINRLRGGVTSHRAVVPGVIGVCAECEGSGMESIMFESRGLEDQVVAES